MKVLKEELILNCTAQKLWSILSDVSRCDWVPTINEITLDGECRIFEMEGMGIVKEKILLNDDSKMMLQYSAIETRTPIDHHLATMHVTEIDENSCTLIWTTEIDPEIFGDAVYQGMLVSIEGITYQINLFCFKLSANIIATDDAIFNDRIFFFIGIFSLYLINL